MAACSLRWWWLCLPAGGGGPIHQSVDLTIPLQIIVRLVHLHGPGALLGGPAAGYVGSGGEAGVAAEGEAGRVPPHVRPDLVAEEGNGRLEVSE